MTFEIQIFGVETFGIQMFGLKTLIAREAQNLRVITSI